ncbi:metallophosphoesterase family protein [Nitrospirota bacterium]
MRIALISDVHANLRALEAVLKHIAGSGQVDAVYHAGDAVGYGPEPTECVERIEKECAASIMGNHDHGLLGLTDIEAFNPIAVSAIEWTRENISGDALETLRALPKTEKVRTPDMLLSHANPGSPDTWEYVMSANNMQSALNATKERFCVIGHSHMPFITELDAEGRLSPHGKGPGKVNINQDSRYLINAGSVGQPRDQDPRAAYVMMDDESIEVVRVEYDVEATAKHMLEKGLHLALSERIKYGF